MRAVLTTQTPDPINYAALQHNPVLECSRYRINLSKESVMTTVKSKTAEKVQAATISVVDTAKDQFAKAAESQFKAADEVAAFGKSNVDAFIRAGSIFFHGFEELTRSFVGMTQAQVETGMSAAKAMIGAKTLTELTDLQNSFSKTAFDSVVSEATHISELAIKIANEAIEPISARVTATMEQMSKPSFAAF
jgi:phasin family protein